MKNLFQALDKIEKAISGFQKLERTEANIQNLADALTTRGQIYLDMQLDAEFRADCWKVFDFFEANNQESHPFHCHLREYYAKYLDKEGEKERAQEIRNETSQFRQERRGRLEQGLRQE